MAARGLNGTIKRKQYKGSSEEDDQEINAVVPEQESGKHENQLMSRPQPQANSTTVAATIFSPVILTSFLLIFGGCCSNVYALESIVKISPASGTLVTFLQFLLTALFALPSQITFRSTVKDSLPGFIPRLRSRIIPLHKWLIYTVFFLVINVLNNAVFNYSISIPLHIILRSASPVTSMLVGYVLTGRRYSYRQVFAVLLLFSGVVLAALSDARSKSTQIQNTTISSTIQIRDLFKTTINAVKSTIETADIVQQLPGFVFLFSALILSAVMGIYTDKIYDQHGRSISVTEENLFYSHVLSLPWFVMQRAKLNAEYTALMDNATVINPSSLASSLVHSALIRVPKVYALMPLSLRHMLEPSTLAVVSLLLVNALTQIICITGVNRLSTETTSLTVTIVLNVRKLVSLLLSIWLFGNTLSMGVAVGAAMVFVGGALYGLGGSKKKWKADDRNRGAPDKGLPDKQKAG